MRLRGFENNGTWDRLAALQQLVLLADLYKERRDAIDALVAGGAEVVHVEFVQGYSWPPSWALFRQDGDYWLTMSGTTNLRQMGGHMWGAFGAVASAVPFPNFRGAFVTAPIVNGQWAALYDTLWPTVRALLPKDPKTFTLRLSGHSYGAALAQLFASYFMRDEQASCEVLTFGSPRVFTSGYDGPMPRACYVVGSTYDPVFHSPPDVNVIYVNLSRTRTGVGLIPDITLGSIQSVKWQHFGRVEYLLSDGETEQQTYEHVTINFVPTEVRLSSFSFKLNPEFRRTADQSIAGADLVSTTVWTEHFTANYVGRVLQSYYGGASG